MNTQRKNAIAAGILFLTAMAASLAGGAAFVEPVISEGDFLNAVSSGRTMLTTGALLELVNAIAVVGIGIIMFDAFKRHTEKMACAYLSLRIIETIFCSIIVICPLSLILICGEYMKTGVLNASIIGTAGYLSIAGRAVVSNLLIPVFFSLGAIVLYPMMYSIKAVPRFISIWGFIGAVLVLLNAMLRLYFNISMGIGIIFVLPMILNEIFLGIWLIAKGFNRLEI